MLFINIFSQICVHHSNRKEMDNEKKLSEIIEELMEYEKNILNHIKVFQKKIKLMINIMKLYEINFQNKIKQIRNILIEV